MSSCYKCGKDLPDGQVECEYGCPVGQDSVAPNLNTELMLVIQAQFIPDDSKLETPEARAAFQAAMHKFITSIGSSFAKSGLSQFCKRPE